LDTLKDGRKLLKIGERASIAVLNLSPSDRSHVQQKVDGLKLHMVDLINQLGEKARTPSMVKIVFILYLFYGNVIPSFAVYFSQLPKGALPIRHLHP
jgi:hypothetical protein